MGSTEQTIDIPAELEKNVCGHMDVNLHKIERTLQVTMIERHLRVYEPGRARAAR